MNSIARAPAALSLRLARPAMNPKSHYENHTTDSYESAFFYEQGAYTNYLRDLVTHRLGLNETTTGTLVDIGGGTGNFTRMLVDKAPALKAVVVDPFLADTTIQDDSVQFVKASAEEYIKPITAPSTWRQGYSQVLLKEVVHHLESSNRVAIFQGMLKGIEQSTTSPQRPSLLIITRPQTEIDYPLWKQAKEVWAANQPHVDDLQQDLLAAGFRQVDYTVEAYPCEISFQRWQSMVKQRFWSTFANFSDDELEAACQTLQETEAHRVDQEGMIRFEDRLIFLQAYI